MIHYFFAWYTGQVWPNIIASAVTTLIGLVFAYWKIKRLHKRSSQALHNHISQEFAKLKSDSNQ